MSENVTNDMQLAAYDTPVENTDWTALYEEVMHEPWTDWVDWSACDEYENPGQGSDGLSPGNGSMIQAPNIVEAHEVRQVDEFHAQEMTLSLSTSTPSLGSTRIFQCNFAGCKAKPFKRVSELNRHKKKHDRNQLLFPCPAVDCDRVGARAFSRNDKLTDHIIAGHDADDRFLCQFSHCACGLSLKRDEMTVHHSALLKFADSPFHRLIFLRFCSFEKCAEKFRAARFYDPGVHAPNMELAHSQMRTHLSQEHSLESRKKFATLIHAQGYHHSTLEILCPVCPNRSTFQKGVDFYQHFLELHCHIGDAGTMATAIRMHQDSTITLFRKNFLLDLFRRCTYIPDGVRQHRRTILRLLPEFILHPVWNDLKAQEREYRALNLRNEA